MKHIVISAVLLLLFVFSASAQTAEPQIVREYSLGDGYVARDVVEGARKYTMVKFPDRMVGSENPCSFVLFAEGMHVALLRVFGENSFLGKEPKVEPRETERGIAFYADTADNHSIEIVVMVQTLDSRYPIGVRMEKIPIQLKKF